MFDYTDARGIDKSARILRSKPFPGLNRGISRTSGCLLPGFGDRKKIRPFAMTKRSCVSPTPCRSVVVAGGQRIALFFGEARGLLHSGLCLGVESGLNVLEPGDEGELVVALGFVAQVSTFEVELGFLVVLGDVLHVLVHRVCPGVQSIQRDEEVLVAEIAELLERERVLLLGPRERTRVVEREIEIGVGLVDRLGVVDGVLAGGVRHLGPDQVDAGVGVDAAPLEVLFPVAVGGAVGVRSGDDDRVLGLLCVDGRGEARLRVLTRDDLLAGDVATALRRRLVLDVDRGDAGLLVLADGAADVVNAAVAGVTVGDDREVRRFDDPLCVLDHLGHRDHLEVREAELTQNRRVARHVRGVQPRHLGEPGVEGVVDARGECEVLRVELLSKLARRRVVNVSCNRLGVLDSACDLVRSVVVVCHRYRVFL